MLNDILAAIPWGFLLAFTIGPVFFVLLETSITKGFRAAMVFDAGVVFGDLVFILIAYFSTNQILERLKDDPGLFIFGGVIMLTYGIISFIKEKKNFLKKRDEEQVEEDNIPKNNYLGLFFKEIEIIEFIILMKKIVFYVLWAVKIEMFLLIFVTQNARYKFS